MSEKRHYETTVIINGSLEEKQISDAVERVGEFIKKQGGEIERSDEWGRKRLAYPIQKKNNGFYVQFAYDAPDEADIARELATFCRIDDDILRELTLVMSDLDLKRREETKARIAEAEAAAEAEERDGSRRRNDDDEDDD